MPHLRSLYNFALQLAGRSDAEDLVQATLLKAVERWPELEARPNLRTWLFVVLRNAWIDQERQRLRRTDAVFAGDDWVENSSTADPEDLFLQREWAQEIQRAVHSLPEVFRLPLYLRDVEGFSYKEIAEILGCPIGTVMSRLARARSLVRAQLFGQMKERGRRENRKTGTEGDDL